MCARVCICLCVSVCDSVDIHGSLRVSACVCVGLCCILPFLLVPASASLHVCLYECHCADIVGECVLQCGGMRIRVSVRGTVIYGSEVIGMLVSVQGHGNMSVSMGNVVCGGGIVV